MVSYLNIGILEKSIYPCSIPANSSFFEDIKLCKPHHIIIHYMSDGLLS